MTKGNTSGVDLLVDKTKGIFGQVYIVGHHLTSGKSGYRHNKKILSSSQLAKSTSGGINGGLVNLELAK